MSWMPSRSWKLPAESSATVLLTSTVRVLIQPENRPPATPGFTAHAQRLLHLLQGCRSSLVTRLSLCRSGGRQMSDPNEPVPTSDSDDDWLTPARAPAEE